MRDCDNCARCGRDGCKSWDCDFVPRKEAIEAWKEKHKTADRKTENNSEKPNNCEDEPQLCRECDDYAGDGMYCASNHIVHDFSTSKGNCEPQMERSE